MRVLLVEGGPVDARRFTTLLRSDAASRHDVRVVGSLDDTLEALSDWQPDAVLLDLELPDSGGLLTLERAVAAAGATPVLVLTGNADPELVDQALRLGAADYVSKDRVTAAGLSRALRNAVHRAELQDRLGRSHRSFQAIVERGQDGLVICTGAGALLYANPAALRLKGLQPACLQVVQAPGQGDVELTLSVGRAPPRLMLVSRSRTVWENATAALLSFRDVTERREAEARARRQEEESRRSQRLGGLGRLAGGIAHEFNNLLMVIRGHAELIEGCSGDTAVQRHAARIAGAADRSTEIARQLMVFASQDQTSPITLDVGAAVQASLSPLGKLVGEDVTVRAALPEAPLCAELVPGQLEQVLVNLVSNARDAVEPGQQIDLALVPLAREGLPGLELSVRDSGSGMDSATQERALEPFFTTKDVGAGTGLGLSAVYGIVHQAGGELRLESRLGRGTTVRVWLPQAPGAGASDDRALGLSPSGARAVVLVAEDEPELRNLVVTVLQAAGHEVFSAPHPAAALALPAADLDRVQVLVSDYAMPGASGLELHAQLSRRLPDLGFVLCSGYTRGAEAARTDLPAGAVFLQKPFSLTALRDAVAEQLERLAARR